MGSRGPREPKPYGFVPLPDQVKRERPAGHDRLDRRLLSGTVTGKLVALTPIHVASGNIELCDDSATRLVKAHFRTRGQIAIPGSSLKGAVRSIVEAITPSCVRVQSRTLWNRLPREFARPCEAEDENASLCPACRMFGAMGYQGQVRFADALLVEGERTIIFAPCLFEPRRNARVYYTNGKVIGRKFYFHGSLASGNIPLEACGVGSCFELRVEFTNLTGPELGVLLIALGQGEQPFALKLGGAKPACCGSVEVKVEKLERWVVVADACNYDSTTTILGADAQSGLIGEARSLLVTRNLEQLRRILSRNEKRSCPSHGY